MDTSAGLITKVVDDAALNKVLRSGIDQNFLSDDTGGVFNYLRRHYADYKVVPSRDAVKAAFPNFEFIQTREPVEYFIDALKESFRRSVLEDKIDVLSQVYNKDTKRAESLLRETLSELVVAQKTFRDVDASATAPERFEAYKTRAQNPGATGILSQWPALDYETLGWGPEQLIVLVGEKWMGKSWQMLHLAHQAVLQGERVLFLTKEMSQEEIIERFDALYAGISYDALRRGELTNVQEKRYEAALDKMAKNNYHFVVAREGVQTIEDIEFKAVETDASIIFGDSIYLFDPDSKGRYSNETNRRMEISRRCKGIATSLGVPFIVSVQAGRKHTKAAEPSLDDIEWSNAFSQDANVVLYIHKDELDKELSRAQMHLLKCRGGSQQIKLFIEQDYEYMRFSQREDQFEPTTDVFTEDDEGISFTVAE